MHYLQTESAHRIKNKCIKSKDPEMITTHRPRVSDMQSSVTKLKSLYTGYPCDGAYLRFKKVPI